jgi:hypothetical protein
MNKWRKYLGMVVDGMIITGVTKYFDLASERMEYGFIINNSYGIHCGLFVDEYLS